MLETIGGEQQVQQEDSDDESGSGGGGFVVPLHRDEKADVVSAVNVGESHIPFVSLLELFESEEEAVELTFVRFSFSPALDVVLQRKTRNPLTGITLVSDTTDSVIRGQMDLVLARAEAARSVLSFFSSSTRPKTDASPSFSPRCLAFPSTPSVTESLTILLLSGSSPTTPTEPTPSSPIGESPFPSVDFDLSRR